MDMKYPYWPPFSQDENVIAQRSTFYKFDLVSVLHHRFQASAGLADRPYSTSLFMSASLFDGKSDQYLEMDYEIDGVREESRKVRCMFW